MEVQLVNSYAGKRTDGLSTWPEALTTVYIDILKQGPKNAVVAWCALVEAGGR
jgi:hypothetical protein